VLLFWLANRGQTAGIVIESQTKTAPNDREIAILRPEGNEIGHLRLEPGESKGIEIRQFDDVALAAYDLKFLDYWYLRGTIIYADDAGIKRRLVFKRVQPKGQDRFRPTGNPDDEYTD
jgi:hypothetical protein